MNKDKSVIGGYTDRRGEWRPKNPITFAPVFVWPPKLTRFLIWLANYLFTWNLFYLGIVLLSYYFLQPPLHEMQTFKTSWILTIFLRNMGLVWIVYGGWHLYLYKFRKRGTKAKYSPRWQSTSGSTFLWNDQVYDNVFWTCASAVPIWTAFEVISFWMYANGKLPYIDFSEHPLYFCLLFLLIPFWRELHFYVIHRLIHWKPLYKHIHYLHHYNINPGPWSGLAMHPVEHILYFSVVLIHWVVPSHPLHFLFNSQHTALTPAPSHSGFEGKLGKFFSFGSYFHYLHHRLFECNYGESTIPLDQWFGIFDDGAQTQTEKAEAASIFRRYKVTNIVEESPEVKSIYLENVANTAGEHPTPGQYLTFKIPFNEGSLCVGADTGHERKINYALRSYTISDIPGKGRFRISVKKETTGLVSKALHDVLHIGDVLEAKGPKGSFVLQRDKGRHRVFIAAGIGITPILAMLKSLSDPQHRIDLIIAVKEEKLLCFKEEIIAICKTNPGIRVHLFFSRNPVESLNDQQPTWHIYNQRLDMETLKQILPRDQKISCYLCGPDQLTRDIKEEIGDWLGKRITFYTENFGIGNNSFVQRDRSNVFQVHLKRSQQTLQWDHDFSNILEFAASNDIYLDAGCMFGECGSCKTKIEGSVAYNHKTATNPGAGNCLPCSCYPTSDISLDV